MPIEHVESRVDCDAAPTRAWNVVQDFCVPWHPSIACMRRELTPKGSVVRAFKVQGDDTLYREQLTYLSHSDRMMAYRHVQGIQGAREYTAQLQILPNGKGGCQIKMSAQITADQPRLIEISKGTQSIFDAGVCAVARRAKTQNPAQAERSKFSSAGPLETVQLAGSPRLVLTKNNRSHPLGVLFLHGIGGNRSNWDNEVKSLAAFCSAGALDLRGYGDSELGHSPTRLEDHFEDIFRAIDAMGAEKIVLCGLSYGAWIAASFAMHHSDQLNALVLCDGCTGMTEASETERRAFLDARETPLNAGKTPSDFAPSVVNLIAGPNSSAEVRKILQESMSQISSGTYRDALRCFANPPSPLDFSTFNFPVLAMTGSHDVLAPPSEIRAVCKRIHDQAATPDIRFEVLENTGHISNLDNPHHFLKHLQDFVSRLDDNI